MYRNSLDTMARFLERPQSVTGDSKRSLRKIQTSLNGEKGFEMVLVALHFSSMSTGVRTVLYWYVVDN